jgi:chemotaxis protein CheD
MNHFLLPDGDDARGGMPASAARYGTYAMELLINDLLKQGARRSLLEAKVFGGGAVVPGMTKTDVGARNARFVLEYLSAEEIPVAARDLEGEFPRKVYYFPRSGKVLVKRLRSLHNRTLIEREAEYSERVNKGPLAGDVELFV